MTEAKLQEIHFRAIEVSHCLNELDELCEKDVPALIAEVRRLRKTLEHIASGTERGGMCVALARCVLNPELNEGGDLEWLEKK